MLNKKIRVGILIAALIFQITVWVVGFTTQRSTFADAVEIYIPVRLVDPYDQFRGSYLAIEIDENRAPIYRLDANGRYWIFDVDGRNYVTAIVRDFTTRGEDVLWAENFEISRFYAEESRAKELERQWFGGAQMWIAVALSGNGEYMVTDIIIE